MTKIDREVSFAVNYIKFMSAVTGHTIQEAFTYRAIQKVDGQDIRPRVLASLAEDPRLNASIEEILVFAESLRVVNNAYRGTIKPIWAPLSNETLIAAHRSRHS